MSYYVKKSIDNSGAAAIISLLGVMAITLSIVAVAATLAKSELKMARSGGVMDETFYAAESGLNEALRRLADDPGRQVFNFELDKTSVAVAVENQFGEPYRRVLTSTAASQNGNQRAVRLTVETGVFGSGFDYAVYAGPGGIHMDSNSLIEGDVFSEASVLPASPGAGGEIDGDVQASYFDSSGSPSKIVDIDISGDATAHGFDDCTIGGEAYYHDETSIDQPCQSSYCGSSDATQVHGAFCPNEYCHPFAPDPGRPVMPLSEADIAEWKSLILAFGRAPLAPNPASCPSAQAAGTYCVTSDQALGPDKIEGNFYVGNGATLLLSGNIWVEGDIVLDNNGKIQIAPALGRGSAVVIADGKIRINNNYTVSGTGDPSSFVFLVSMSPSLNLSQPAIYAANNSDSIVFAALKGVLKVKNNGLLNAAQAYALWLEPNAKVNFNPQLSAFSVPLPTGNYITSVVDSWQEL